MPGVGRYEKKAAEQATEKATEKATENTLLQDVRNVMEAFQVSAEQAMKALKIPESESSKFLSML